MPIDTVSYTNPEPASGVERQMLQRQIVAAGLPRPRGAEVSGGNVTVWFLSTDALDAGDQTTLTSTVAAHDGDDRRIEHESVIGLVEDIYAAKRAAATFAYGGNTFPLDDFSRGMWMEIYASRAAHTYSGVTQPRMMNVDGANVLLTNAADVVAHVEAMGVARVALHNAAQIAKVGAAVAATLTAAATVATTYQAT